MVKLGCELFSLIPLSLMVLVLSSTIWTVSGQASTSQTSASAPVPSQPLVSIPLANYYNSEYSGQLQIGPNNQSFNLVFDTASLWIWIPGDKISSQMPNTTAACNSSAICSVPGYGDAVKAGFKYISHSEQVNGYLVQDKLALTTSVTTVNQTFLLATTSIGYLYSDGVCGLTFGNPNQPTLVENLYNSQIINRRAFGLYLSDNSESYGEANSEITLGGPNPKYYTGEFTNVSVKNFSQYWQLDLDGILLNGPNDQTTASIQIGAYFAVIASGVSNILMAKKDFSDFAASFSSNFDLGCTYDANFNLLCDCVDGDISAFPTLSFVLAEQLFTINASLYLDVQQDVCTLLIQGALDDGTMSSTNQNQNNSANSNTTNTTEGTPLNPNVALQPGSYIILGGVFLRNYYTLFDVDHQQVSFATVVHPSNALIGALEVIMIIFAAFISIMFMIFAGRFVRFWARRIPKVDGSSTEKFLEKRSTSIQLMQA